jgi:phosphatidylglycerophosphate synthase
VVAVIQGEARDRSVPLSRPRHPRSRLAVALAIGLLLALSLAAVLVGIRLDALAATLAAYTLGSGFALGLLKPAFPHPTLGWANLVTVGRMALLAGLVSAAIGSVNPWVVVGVASLILTLDGVDGYLARRHNRVSHFGARLDMEVDAALAVVLALIALATSSVGALVVLLAAPRYLFVAAAAVGPWLRATLPESRARKVMMVVQVVTLIALQVPGFFGTLTAFVVAAVAGGLLWSFGRDIIWLWHNRPHPEF